MQCFMMVAVETDYARMSKVYERTGCEFYLDAGGREHD